MNDDYLWDRSGTPDPEVQRLEQLLGRYKHQEPLKVVPHRRRWIPLAIAASLIILVAATTLAVRFYWPSGEPWDIQSVSGPATINGKPVSPHDRFGIGDTLVTGDHAHVVVRVARVGELEVAPGTELELAATNRRRHRITLRRGSIDARVWAPPFTFGVNTPAGLASDIGCAFNIRYQDDAGLLKVTSGWVDFDGDLRSSLVPQGAMAELSRTLGPGTPYWTDAPPALIEALREFDSTSSTAALHRVLAAARPRDAMTVLHLLERAKGEHRAPLFDRLALLAPPPRGVTRERVIERDLQMIDQWRRHLGLGGVKKWWIYWRDAFPED